MKYEFHVGDYVETKHRDIGIITEIASNVFWWYCVCGKGPLSKMHEHAFSLKPNVVVESAFNRIGNYDFTNETRSDNMKYNFHVGDYVETKTGTIGFVSNTTYVEGEYPRWMPTKLSLTDIHNNLYSLDESYYIIDEDVEKRFNRIGKYDFAKKAEDKDESKIKPLVTSHVLKNIDGKEECYFDSCEVIEKINELVEAVNRLKEKVNGMAQS